MAAQTSSLKWFTGSDRKESSRDLLSGMVSGFFCKGFEYPFDTIKVMQQTAPAGRYTGPYDCFQQTVKAKGIMSLYNGLTSPLLGAMAENATLFVAFGAITKQLNVPDDPTLSDPVPMWKYYTAGALSGVVSAFVLTPVELVKCHLQVQNAATGAAALRFKGPVDVVMQTIRAEGIQGMWKGNVSCLVREIPGNFAWFGAYETVKYSVQVSNNYERMSDVPLPWTAFSGAVAGVMYWLVPYPADTVKSRIQTEARFSKSSFLDVMRTVVKEEGVGGLYKGVGITCARAAPSHALIFYFYELTSEHLKKY